MQFVATVVDSVHRLLEGSRSCVDLTNFLWLITGPPLISPSPPQPPALSWISVLGGSLSRVGLFFYMTESGRYGTCLNIDPSGKTSPGL